MIEDFKGQEKTIFVKLGSAEKAAIHPSHRKEPTCIIPVHSLKQKVKVPVEPEEIEHYFAQLYTYVAQGYNLVFRIDKEELWSDEANKIYIGEQLKRLSKFIGNYKNNTLVRPTDAKYIKAFKQGLESPDEQFTPYNNTAVKANSPKTKKTKIKKPTQASKLAAEYQPPPGYKVVDAIGAGKCGPGAAILVAASAIVKGDLDDVLGQHARNAHKKQKRQIWKTLFNENKIDGKGEWKFKAIKQYFAEQDTYLKQQRLQEIFAPLLRDEIVKIILTNENSLAAYKEKTVNAFQEAFEEYVKSRLDEEYINQDDIFIGCPSVKEFFDKHFKGNFEQFLKAYKKAAPEKQKEWRNKKLENLAVMLEEFWNFQEGAEKFIGYISQAGTWIGDIELSLLLDKLGFNLQVSNYGNTRKRDLSFRQVNEPEYATCWKNEFILAFRNNGATKDAAEIMLAQLQERDILVKFEDVKHYDPDDTNRHIGYKLKAHPDKLKEIYPEFELALALYNKYYIEQPPVILVNPGKGHWQGVVSTQDKFLKNADQFDFLQTNNTGSFDGNLENGGLNNNKHMPSIYNVGFQINKKTQYSTLIEPDDFEFKGIDSESIGQALYFSFDKLHVVDAVKLEELSPKNVEAELKILKGLRKRLNINEPQSIQDQQVKEKLFKLFQLWRNKQIEPPVSKYRTLNTLYLQYKDTQGESEDSRFNAFYEQVGPNNVINAFSSSPKQYYKTYLEEDSGSEESGIESSGEYVDVEDPEGQMQLLFNDLIVMAQNDRAAVLDKRIRQLEIEAVAEKALIHLFQSGQWEKYGETQRKEILGDVLDEAYQRYKAWDEDKTEEKSSFDLGENKKEILSWFPTYINTAVTYNIPLPSDLLLVSALAERKSVVVWEKQANGYLAPSSERYLIDHKESVHFLKVTDQEGKEAYKEFRTVNHHHPYILMYSPIYDLDKPELQISKVALEKPDGEWAAIHHIIDAEEYLIYLLTANKTYGGFASGTKKYADEVRNWKQTLMQYLEEAIGMLAVLERDPEKTAYLLNSKDNIGNFAKYKEALTFAIEVYELLSGLKPLGKIGKTNMERSRYDWAGHERLVQASRKLLKSKELANFYYKVDLSTKTDDELLDANQYRFQKVRGVGNEKLPDIHTRDVGMTNEGFCVIRKNKEGSFNITKKIVTVSLQDKKDQNFKENITIGSVVGGLFTGAGAGAGILGFAALGVLASGVLPIAIGVGVIVCFTAIFIYAYLNRNSHQKKHRNAKHVKDERLATIKIQVNPLEEFHEINLKEALSQRNDLAELHNEPYSAKIIKASKKRLINEFDGSKTGAKKGSKKLDTREAKLPEIDIIQTDVQVGQVSNVNNQEFDFSDSDEGNPNQKVDERVVDLDEIVIQVVNVNSMDDRNQMQEMDKGAEDLKAALSYLSQALQNLLIVDVPLEEGDNDERRVLILYPALEEAKRMLDQLALEVQNLDPATINLQVLKKYKDEVKNIKMTFKGSDLEENRRKDLLAMVKAMSDAIKGMANAVKFTNIGKQIDDIIEEMQGLIDSGEAKQDLVKEYGIKVAAIQDTIERTTLNDWQKEDLLLQAQQMSDAFRKFVHASNVNLIEPGRSEKNYTTNTGEAPEGTKINAFTRSLLSVESLLNNNNLNIETKKQFHVSLDKIRTDFNESGPVKKENIDILGQKLADLEEKINQVIEENSKKVLKGMAKNNMYSSNSKLNNNITSGTENKTYTRIVQ